MMSDPVTILTWIIFYTVTVFLFYWCFRRSVNRMTNMPSSSNSNNPESSSYPGANYHTHAAAAGSGSASEYRRNVFVIANGSSGNSSDPPNHAHPIDDLPPEYGKWEELPPSYEESIQQPSFENPSFVPDDNAESGVISNNPNGPSV